MDFSQIKGVGKLYNSEPCFIQILLSKFVIQKTNSDCVLTIEFDETEQAITHRKTKERLRDAIPNYKKKAEEYQKIFDYIFFEKSIGSYRYNDPDFRFRYASGGTLPILLMNGQEYYCLFFRDVFPLGWNIANGGCDSLTELLDPTVTIGRELREELIILALLGNREYVYQSSEGKTIERPEFEMARELWNEYFRKMDFRKLKPFEVDIDWIDGPDRLSATFTSRDGLPIITNPTTRCFVNITTEDFSIEIDKIARIPVESHVLILDGEITKHKILGRPIGLFEVNKTEQKFLAGEKDFFPDIVYFFGNPKPSNHKDISDLVKNLFIPRLIKEGIREDSHLTWHQEQNNIFQMCPITSRMIRRYISYKSDLTIADPTINKVFISYASKDEDFVAKLWSKIEKNDISCFKAPDKLKPGDGILESIFSAIGTSDKFLIILSKNSIYSPWVEYEVNEAIRLEAKTRKKTLIPIRIDETALESDKAWVKRLLSLHVEDFCQWKNPSLYEKAFGKLLSALKSKV